MVQPRVDRRFRNRPLRGSAAISNAARTAGRFPQSLLGIIQRLIKGGHFFLKRFDALAKVPRLRYGLALIRFNFGSFLVGHSPWNVGGRTVAIGGENEAHIGAIPIAPSGARQSLTGFGGSAVANACCIRRPSQVFRVVSLQGGTVRQRRKHKMKSKPPDKPRDGAECKVIGGTHKGKTGIVRDIKTGKTGYVSITVVQRNGDKFKTLAQNVEIQKL
jgi:hypothetical protein